MPNQRKIAKGSFCVNELLGVLLSLHRKKHAFTVVGIVCFGGWGIAASIYLHMGGL